MQDTLDRTGREGRLVGAVVEFGWMQGDSRGIPQESWTDASKMAEEEAKKPALAFVDRDVVFACEEELILLAEVSYLLTNSLELVLVWRGRQ